MVRINKQIGSLFLFVLFSFLSCTKEGEASQDGREEEGSVVNLPIALSGMETLTTNTSTRSADEKKGMSVSWGQSMETRAEQDKSPDEMKVTKLYILQFDGTTVDAKLLQCVRVAVPFMTNGSGVVKIEFKPTVTSASSQGVYMVANVDLSAYTTNTSLTKGVFDGVLMKIVSPMASVPAEGLPMCAYNAFNPAAASPVPTFNLKTMLAKIVYTYSMDASLTNFLTGNFALKLKQVANGTSYSEPELVNNAHTPTGLTRTTEIPLGTLTVGSTAKLTGTYYIPENIAGQTTGVMKDWERSEDLQPLTTYFELAGVDKNYSLPVIYRLCLGDPTNLNDFNVRRNNAYNVTVNISGVNTTDKRVNALTNLSVDSEGRYATANCYIVAANLQKYYSNLGWYSFDITKRGNGDESLPGIDYSSLPNLSRATNARVIWSTGNGISEYRLVNGKILFRVGNEEGGNVIIGVFDSASSYDCLWSWHIWIVDRAPIRVGDRNLGAYNATTDNVGAIGLLYQWGNKNPFPGAVDYNANEPSVRGWYASSTSSKAGEWSGTYYPYTLTTEGSEAFVTKYPTVFLAELGRQDWLSTRNDNLWNAPNSSGRGSKTIYDPCPIGYRVPSSADSWGFMYNTLHGIDTGSGGWFPHAGGRVNGGPLSTKAQNGNGWYWLTGASASEGAVWEYSSYSTGTSAKPRIWALPVRCVRE